MFKIVAKTKYIKVLSISDWKINILIRYSALLALASLIWSILL